ncbi:MAG: host attachment protein [Magnetospirillum sp.]|nr:host attachment protein [Magnetospirillum sp.]
MSRKPTWILVADGGRAFALTNSEAPDKFKPVADFHFEGFRGCDADIGTDRPVRTHAVSGQTAGSASWENGKLAKIEHRKFLKGVIEAADKRHRAGDFQHLALVAPPRALGDLRVALSSALAETVILEVAADYTKMPQHEIGPKILPLLRP